MIHDVGAILYEWLCLRSAKRTLKSVPGELIYAWIRTKWYDIQFDQQTQTRIRSSSSLSSLFVSRLRCWWQWFSLVFFAVIEKCTQRLNTPKWLQRMRIKKKRSGPAAQNGKLVSIFHLFEFDFCDRLTTFMSANNWNHVRRIAIWPYAVKTGSFGRKEFCLLLFCDFLCEECFMTIIISVTFSLSISGSSDQPSHRIKRMTKSDKNAMRSNGESIMRNSPPNKKSY